MKRCLISQLFIFDYAMLENYFPILLFILIGLAVGVLPMAFGWLFAPQSS